MHGSVTLMPGDVRAILASVLQMNGYPVVEGGVKINDDGGAVIDYEIKDLSVHPAPDSSVSGLTDDIRDIINPEIPSAPRPAGEGGTVSDSEDG